LKDFSVKKPCHNYWRKKQLLTLIKIDSRLQWDIKNISNSCSTVKHFQKQFLGMTRKKMESMYFFDAKRTLSKDIFQESNSGDKLETPGPML